MLLNSIITNNTDVQSSFDLRSIKNSDLVSALHHLSETDPDYWTFRHSSARAGSHGLSQYPAMMVPKMLEGLLDAVEANQGRIRSVFDPFVGSGTTLVECQRRGLCFSGQDINPLAILLCQVKSGPFPINRLKEGYLTLKMRLKDDRLRRTEIDFDGISKWFSPVARIELSRIRRSITQEERRWIRRVFWVALAETIRLTSNSRTSTFKLHIRSREELDRRNTPVLHIFERILENIIDRLEMESAHILKQRQVCEQDEHQSKIEINLGDIISSPLNSCNGKHDLLITSPPYGDNTSTVPYGQYSYLPLKWIDLKDISKHLHQDSVPNAYAIDAASLGGSRMHALDRVKDLRHISPTLNRILLELQNYPRDRAARVAAFCADLDIALDPILKRMKSGAHMIWVTGNRRVGGHSVPLDKILVELLEAKNALFIHQIRRRIPNKRMATRNNVTTTMREESIQILRLK